MFSAALPLKGTGAGILDGHLDFSLWIASSLGALVPGLLRTV